jgi:predicted ester cyclase
MCRWRNSGTHHGEFLGIPATGKRVTVEGMSIQRIANGKIIDDAGYFDLLAIQQQLSGEGTV